MGGNLYCSTCGELCFKECWSGTTESVCVCVCVIKTQTHIDVWCTHDVILLHLSRATQCRQCRGETLSIALTSGAGALICSSRCVLLYVLRVTLEDLRADLNPKQYVQECSHGESEISWYPALCAGHLVKSRLGERAVFLFNMCCTVTRFYSRIPL